MEVQLFVKNKIAFPSQISISHSQGEINQFNTKSQPVHRMEEESSFEVEDESE